MAYEEILYDVSDRIATVTLNRPTRLNAWTMKMEQEVEHAMLAAAADSQVRVIILNRAGRALCAGADLANLDGLAQSKNTTETLKQIMGDRFSGRGPAVCGPLSQTHPDFPAIELILGAINGAAAGLGLVVSLYCDIRFASDQAKFSTAFARRGLIAEHGISWTLPRLVGVAMCSTCSTRPG